MVAASQQSQTSSHDTSNKSLRTPLLAGNWKMFKTLSESQNLAEELKKTCSGLSDREVLICPPFTSLAPLASILKGSNISLGAQNLHWENQGAYTGEVSGPMLKAAGCSHVLIGHSERRQYFSETNETVNKKINAALSHSLIPVVCVGETLSERESGTTFKVVETQVKEGLKGLSPEQYTTLVIAYEPVWAIGTGKTATPDQAQEVHAFIRKTLSGLFGEASASKTRILYGGSVKPDNIDTLMAQPDIDGGLVGGASLKAPDFSRIVNYNR